MNWSNTIPFATIILAISLSRETAACDEPTVIPQAYDTPTKSSFDSTLGVLNDDTTLQDWRSIQTHKPIVRAPFKLRIELSPYRRINHEERAHRIPNKEKLKTRMECVEEVIVTAQRINTNSGSFHHVPSLGHGFFHNSGGGPGGQVTIPEPDEDDRIDEMPFNGHGSDVTCNTLEEDRGGFAGSAIAERIGCTGVTCIFMHVFYWQDRIVRVQYTQNDYELWRIEAPSSPSHPNELTPIPNTCVDG